MKRYYSIFLLSFFLGACQDSLKEGFGYLQFSSVELNKTVIPTSKATGETTEKIALDLIRDGEVIRHVDDWTSLKGESLLLPTGTYVVKLILPIKMCMLSVLKERLIMPVRQT